MLSKQTVPSMLQDLVSDTIFVRVVASIVIVECLLFSPCLLLFCCCPSQEFTKFPDLLSKEHGFFRVPDENFYKAVYLDDFKRREEFQRRR